jgi:uncharacterized protein
MLHTFEFSHRGVSRYYLFESENSSLLKIERPVFLYVKNMSAQEKNGGLTDAEKDLTNAEKDLSTSAKGLTNAKKDLANAEKDLTNAEKDLSTSAKDLANAKKNLANTEKEKSGLTNAEKDLSTAEKDLTDKEKNLANAEKEKSVLSNAEKDLTNAEKDGLTDAEREEFNSLDKSVIDEIAAELNELKRRGIIGVKEKRIDIKKSGFIKSLCLNVCHDCNLRCAYCFAAQGSYDNTKREKTNEANAVNTSNQTNEANALNAVNISNDANASNASNTLNKANAVNTSNKTNAPNDEKYMSLKTALAAVDFLIKASGPRRNLEIDFFGGEPLMNFGVVKKTVEYARQKCLESGKKIGFTMTTNGLLLNKKTAEYLNENMDNVVISVDGRRAVHDALRKTAGGVGSFDAVLKNALEFRAIRGSKRYYIRGTYTRKNLDFGEDILFLNDCGFDQLSIEPVVLESGDPLSIRPSDTEKIKSEYARFASEYLERRKTAKWFNFFHFMIDLDKGPCVYKRLNGCGAGDEYAAVTPSGDIYPCHQFIGKPEFRMGCVFDGISDGISNGGISSGGISYGVYDGGVSSCVILDFGMSVVFIK